MSEVVPVEKASYFDTKHPFKNARQSVGSGLKLPLKAEVGKRSGQFSRHINAAGLTALFGIVTLP
jgi:hypothetical protein